jgi:hypothetical protein
MTIKKMEKKSTKAVPDMKIVLLYVRRGGVEHPGVYTQVAYFLEWIADTWV